jgi:GMP synthase-like glutamine amidotransferase
MAYRKHLLVVENENGAGPEMFGPWLKGAGVKVELCRAWAGEQVPVKFHHDGLMVLGGAMGATDDEKAPWLLSVREMLAKTVLGGLPVLGICLGAQMLASACGGRVEKRASGVELGLSEIELTEVARDDTLFSAVASPAEAVQWHNDDVTELPLGAVVLASSASCRVQAFRIGKLAWGVQFHPEVSGAVLRSWASSEGPMSSELRRQMDDTIAAVTAAETRLFPCWKGLAERFASVLEQA